MENDIYRGDIFYIDYGQYTGSEQRAGRPGIVVSNDLNNLNSTTIEVVYLTTQPKENLPTHVTVRSTGKASTVLCEQITTVSKERIGKYIASCTESEMDAIDRAIMISLQLNFPETNKDEDSDSKEIVQDNKENPTVEVVDISRVVAEREIYKDMYEKLLAQIIGVNKP